MLDRYILSVCAACMLCYIWHTISPDGSSKKRSWYIGSLIVVLAVLSPLVTLDEADLDQAFQDYEWNADIWQEEAEAQQRAAWEAIISKECKEYIWNKAQAFETISLNIDFTFSAETDPPIPVSVTISGSCSSEAKSFLQDIIETDLGISKEHQQWLN